MDTIDKPVSAGTDITLGELLDNIATTPCWCKCNTYLQFG